MMVHTLCRIVEDCYFCKIVMIEPPGNLTSLSLYLASSATIKACWRWFLIDKSEIGFIIYAGIAQLVEHNLAKVGVAGSSPVSRSVGREL